MVENLDWKPVLAGVFKDPEHINRLEVRSVALAWRRICRDPMRHGFRYLHLTDPWVVALGVAKGRSSRFCLNSVYRRMRALILATGVIF